MRHGRRTVPHASCRMTLKALRSYCTRTYSERNSRLLGLIHYNIDIIREKGSENKLWVLEDDAQINEAISAAAQAMKSDLPKQMDPMTTWIGADNSGRRSLLYTYQLNFTANDLGGSWSAVARGVEKITRPDTARTRAFFGTEIMMWRWNGAT